MFFQPPQAPPDSLLHPRDLGSWRRWESSRHRTRLLTSPLRRTVSLARSAPASTPMLSWLGDRPSVLVVDAAKSSLDAALLQPLTQLVANGAELAVVSPPDVVESLPPTPEGTWHSAPLRPELLSDHLRSVSTVLASGHYLPLGAQAYHWARKHGVRFCVVQHGLLTPFVPPLPEDAHLLAWSEADARFWISGRTDITYEVVGSQLLWRAAQEPSAQVDPGSRPTFLGQLHGAELGRAYMTRVSQDFCARTGALYRPHPSEADRISRITHSLWQRQGIEIDHGTPPLHLTSQPVVSVFSTGVLEAAARGVPAWVCPAPVEGPHMPDWLKAFHARYSMAPWGGSPTPRPDIARTQPALEVARALLNT